MQKFKGGEEKFSILKNQPSSAVSITAATSKIITQIFQWLPRAHSQFTAARERFHVGVHTFHYHLPSRTNAISTLRLCPIKQDSQLQLKF